MKPTSIMGYIFSFPLRNNFKRMPFSTPLTGILQQSPPPLFWFLGTSCSGLQQSLLLCCSLLSRFPSSALRPSVPQLSILFHCYEANNIRIRTRKIEYRVSWVKRLLSLPKLTTVLLKTVNDVFVYVTFDFFYTFS